MRRSPYHGAFLSRGGVAIPAIADISIVQSLLLNLALIVIFVASVYTGGYVAKRVGVDEATYARALWASLFANVASGVAIGLMTALRVPFLLALLLVASLLPTAIYRKVFLSTWSQALHVWILVLITEVLLGVVLTFGALQFGAWLENRFEIQPVTVAHV